MANMASSNSPPGGIVIVLPEQANLKRHLDSLLIDLMKTLVERKLAKPIWGILSGEFGLGVHFENDTFVIRPDCQCGDDACLYCSSTTPLPNFMHKPSGSTVTWYKWIGREMKADLKASVEEIRADCLASLEQNLDERPLLIKDKAE